MKNILITILFSVISLAGFCQGTPYVPVNPNRVLTSSFPFLNFTYDARSAGLGNSGVALSPDANSGLMNPAKLIFLNNYVQASGDSLAYKTLAYKSERNNYDSLQANRKATSGISLSYTPYARQLINDMNLYNLNLYKLKENGVFNLSLKYFDAGRVIMRDISGNFLGDAVSEEFAISGSYSKRLSKYNSMGVGLKYVYSNLGGKQAVANGIYTMPSNSVNGDIYFFHNGQRIIFSRDSVFRKADSSYIYNRSIPHLEKNVWLNYGITLTNIGPKVNYGDFTKRSFQPTQLKVGIAENFALGNEKETTLTLSVDAAKLLVPTPAIVDANNNVIKGVDPTSISGLGTIFQSWGTAPNGLSEMLREITFAFGAELNLKRVLTLRGGYFSENKVKGNQHYYTLGAGLQVKRIALDFAYLIPTQTGNPIANTWRISLAYRFERK